MGLGFLRPAQNLCYNISVTTKYRTRMMEDDSNFSQRSSRHRLRAAG